MSHPYSIWDDPQLGRLPIDVNNGHVFQQQMSPLKFWKKSIGTGTYKNGICID